MQRIQGGGQSGVDGLTGTAQHERAVRVNLRSRVCGRLLVCQPVSTLCCYGRHNSATAQAHSHNLARVQAGAEGCILF
jgi:hypothetical protein